VLPHDLSTDDGQHLACAPVAHPHAEALLSGERRPRSWVDAVIDGDDDLQDAIAERAASALDRLLSVLDLAVAS
jgi:hypothetical protein